MYQFVPAPQRFNRVMMSPESVSELIALLPDFSTAMNDKALATSKPARPVTAPGQSSQAQAQGQDRPGPAGGRNANNLKSESIVTNNKRYLQLAFSGSSISLTHLLVLFALLFPCLVSSSFFPFLFIYIFLKFPISCCYSCSLLSKF